MNHPLCILLGFDEFGFVPFSQFIDECLFALLLKLFLVPQLPPKLTILFLQLANLVKQLLFQNRSKLLLRQAVVLLQFCDDFAKFPLLLALLFDFALVLIHLVPKLPVLGSKRLQLLAGDMLFV